MGVHVVIGFGPAGAALARLLTDMGEAVRVISRSPHPEEPGVEHVSVDASDTRSLIDIAGGSSAIYSCAAPPYPRWRREWPPLAASINAAAEASGAVLVLLSNLYGYGPVADRMTEDLPLAAAGHKGRIRAETWRKALELHRLGRIRVVEARASDFFGPGVVDGGHLAGRAVPQILSGRAVQALGDPAAVHSWTYVPDVARTLARLATEPSAWGRPWHVPTADPLSVRSMVDRIARQAGVAPVPVRGLSGALLRAVAPFSPMMRELREVRYQFDRPFVVDSSAYTTAFNEQPTSIDEQIQATVDWWLTRVGLPRTR